MQSLKIAAAGDVHATVDHGPQLRESFERAAVDANVIMLAGDLTADGEAAEAEILADACRPLDVPVFAVLGNHDHHLGQHDEIAETLRRAGVRVLIREAAVCEVNGIELGVVGTKGFVGGFAGSSIPRFCEPLPPGGYGGPTE